MVLEARPPARDRRQQGVGGACWASASDFGEPEMKAFVGHTRTSAGRLERALGGLKVDRRIALLHYPGGRDPGRRAPRDPRLPRQLPAGRGGRPGRSRPGPARPRPPGSRTGTTPGGVPVRNVAAPVIGRAYEVFRSTPRTPRFDQPPRRRAVIRPPELGLGAALTAAANVAVVHGPGHPVAGHLLAGRVDVLSALAHEPADPPAAAEAGRTRRRDQLGVVGEAGQHRLDVAGGARRARRRARPGTLGPGLAVGDQVADEPGVAVELEAVPSDRDSRDRDSSSSRTVICL